MKNIDNIEVAKSFYLLGDSLNHCYGCKYCRLNYEKNVERHNNILPTEINPNFKNIPIAINLFYGDPLLQIDNTIKYLKKLEKANHTGPIIIVTKGDYRLFPDLKFNLDLHIAFSTFGKDSYLDGNTMNRFENNLKEIKKRKNNYKYSIEFRPIIYNVNDDIETIERVFKIANKYKLPIGYSGLQGKKENVELWNKEKINLKPYPGYNFGHKKIITKRVEEIFLELSQKYNVPIFKKTSCLFSYVHNLNRDYNAHYYRPNEMGCYDCIMKDKCFKFKKELTTNTDLTNILPFKYEIVYKKNHECILKKNKICEYPTNDCSHISGYIIKIKDILTTADVRIIKWLTGYTVDAKFYESSKISDKWFIKK